MSIYDNIAKRNLIKRPIRIVSNALSAFISGERTCKPFKLKFESSTLCNLKCTMCPLTRGLKRKTGVLKFKNFKKVYDEVKAPYINLTGLGEPLLNPDIFRIIKYARENGSLVKLDTNATLLTTENISRLIESNPTFISISIDGVTKKSYESVRVGSNFKNVVSNLKELIKYRDKVKSDTEIHLFFVLQEKNIAELIEFIKFGNDLKVDAINGNIAISFGSAKNDKININKNKIKDIRKEIKEIKKKIQSKLNIENIEEFLKNPENLEERMAQKPCFYPWYNPCVTWDGYVVPCDIHCDNEVVFGNAFEEPFMKIWNNKKARNFRKQLVKKRIGVCSRCCVDESYISDKFKIFYKTPLKFLSKRKIR